MKRHIPRLFAIMLVALMLNSFMQSMTIIDQKPESVNKEIIPDYVPDAFLQPFNGDFNLTNEYQKIWEPNNIRGSTHAIAVTDDKEWMATAGGYLNDREVHIYRWFEPLHQYYPVFDAGDGIIQADVMDVDFMDCDNNGRLEVVAGSADGRIYVFEQLGNMSEPFNLFAMAHQWELVWTSGRTIDRQVWSVVAYDIDHDYHEEIIAGAWDNKVWVFDYIDRSAYPYCMEEHWIEFQPVWNSGDTITGRVNSVCVTDSDNDTRLEIVAGSQDHKVYLFEERPCLKHTYELRWTSGDAFWAPINSVTASQNLDDDNFGEIVASAYGQAVIIFDYDHTTEDFNVRKINQGIKSWERGISLTTGVYTGYEADEWIDRKIYGWEGQGIHENDPIPAPYITVELGGASALGGPWDDQEATFDSTEYFAFQGMWEVDAGSYDIAAAPDGSFYIVDYYNEQVTRVTEFMEPILIFGESGIENGQFDFPTGITVDDEGFVYVADFMNSRVQKFTPEGEFIASWGENGTEDGQFFYVFDVAVWDGRLYASDYLNHRIHVMNASTGELLYYIGEPGTGNGQFDMPGGLTFDIDGMLYVADVNNDRVQKFDSEGNFTMQIGTPGSLPGELNVPAFVVVDNDFRVYVSDNYNDRVQKFSPSGDFESLFGSYGTNPGEMNGPLGLAFHPLGGILVIDGQNNRIQRFGVQDYELLDVFNSHQDQYGAFDIDFDSEGNFYVTDHATPYVFKFSPTGEFLLNWTLPDGWYSYAWGVEIDDENNVFIYDGDYNKIYHYDTMGNLTHSFGVTGTAPGEIRDIRDIALDDGLIYVTDMYNNRISIFDYSGGFISTFGSGGFGLGEFDGPYGIEIGPNGLVYVSEWWNSRIQRFHKNGTPIDYWSSPDVDLFMAFDDQGFLYATGMSYHTLKKYTTDGILIDVLDYDIGNPIVENLGTMVGLGITWRSENQSLFIADNDGKIYMMRPSIALNDIATAVVDFGRWEEIGGDATNDYDLVVVIEDDIDLENIELSISNDLEEWIPLEFNDEFTQYLYYNFGFLGYTGFIFQDVDHALRAAKWDEFRYMKIGVKGGVTYNIDCAFGTVARPITTALVVTTGFIHTGSSSDDTEKIIVGTVDGEIMAYTGEGDFVWESQSDQPKFSLGTSIWDIVQVNGKGMVPTWIEDGSLLSGADVTIDYPTFNDFISFDIHDIDGTDALDIVATIHQGSNARLVYYRNIGSNEFPIFFHVPNYFVTQSTLISELVYDHATVTMADMDGDFDLDMILCDAGYEPDTGLIITVRYFEQTSSLPFWTERPDYLSDIETIVDEREWLPRIALVDMDFDGDLDLTLSLDYLYYFERTGYSSGYKFYYSRDDSMYQAINGSRRNETVFGKVTFWDFDLDGDIDIIVPHSTENYTVRGYNCEAGRFTYWRNTGTRKDIEWTRTRSMFEPDFTGTLLNPERGHDYPAFRDMDGDGLLDLICLRDNSIDIFRATLDHDSFLCATYPYIHMVEVDKRTQANGYWGYEAYDSWTNWLIFESWSRSLEYGDVDMDGKPEVFVGSFDNNIIAFEQVANNTYRRSWRSLDFFLQNWLADMVNETFPFQMNIRDMVIGDQDNDGKQEIIVCAGLTIYVFEVIENDFYELVWISAPLSYFPFSMTHRVKDPVLKQPYVLAVDKDLDGDEKPEILVGAQDTLFYFENVGDNNYTMIGYQQFHEVEAGVPFIRGIITEDINRDGTRDIVVVGTDDVYHAGGYIEYSYGWAKFINNIVDADGNPEDNNYTQFHEERPQGACYCVDIADHDHDGTPDIFIGISNGINIYECDATGLPDYIKTLPTADATLALRAGNTDGDTWFELVAGTGKNLTVFEQNQTEDREDHIYDNVWNSGELHEEITDIRLGDSNVNNRTEIIATARKGYLYAYEWVVNSSAIGLSPDVFLASTSSDSYIDSGPTHSSSIAVMDMKFGCRKQRRFSF